MLYRITITSKFKDRARTAMEKHFQHYLTYAVDQYSDNVKDIGHIFEVDTADSSAPKVVLAANDIAAAIGSPVVVQGISSHTKVFPETPEA